MTQAKLGELVGVPWYTIKDWERGNGRPNCDLIVRLKHALNCSYEELLEGAAE